MVDFCSEEPCTIPKRNFVAAETLISERHRDPMTEDRSTPRYASLQEFLPYYLSEHKDTTCRVLHFIGTGLIAVWILLALITRNAWWLVLIPVGGYGFAWVGHGFFERNKPATFQYPFYSLAGDFILFWRLLIGKEHFRPKS